MAFSAEYVYRILDRYTGPMDKIVRSQQKYIKATGIAQAKTKKFRQSLNKFGQDARRVGSQMTMRMTLPIAAVGTVGVVAFAKLEKGLINVNNLLSRPELARFGGDLERLQEEALKAGFSIADTNQGLFDTISALGAGKRGFDMFSVAQKLAIGGATDLGVAVDGLTTLMSVYESDNVTATQAANALFSAQVKGKTTVAELSAGMGNVASTAKMAGVGMDEMLASLSAMTLGGINTDSAVTALNASLLALAKPQKDAAKLMDRMGISYGVANIKAKGLQAIFKEIAVAQKKHGEQNVMRAIPERRALKAIAALVSGGKIGKIAEIMDKINADMKTGDGLMRAFGDMSSSMSMKYARATGQMTVALKSFVVLMAPAINAILGGITLVGKIFSLIPRDIKVVIIIFLTLLAVIGPLVAILGGLAFAVSSIIAVLPILALVFGSVATWAMFAGIAMGGMLLPILAIAVALGSIVFAIQQVIAKWETLSRAGFLKDLKGWVTFQDPNAGIVPAEEGAQGPAIEKQQARIAAKQAAGKAQGLEGNINITKLPGFEVDAKITNNLGDNLATVG